MHSTATLKTSRVQRENAIVILSEKGGSVTRWPVGIGVRELVAGERKCEKQKTCELSALGYVCMYAEEVSFGGWLKQHIH